MGKFIDTRILTTLLQASLAIVAVGLAVGILMLVAMWRIFTKANEEGWKSLIPFYGSYVLAKIVWRKGEYYWYCLIAQVVLNLLKFLWPGFAVIGGIVTIAYWIMLCIGLCNVFGQSGGFAAGLILLPVIFFPILAFGSAKYYTGATRSYNRDTSVPEYSSMDDDF